MAKAKLLPRKPVYERLVLKLSGESLSGPQDSGIHAETIQGIAREVKEVRDLGVKVAIMVGGGNIFRGTRQKQLAIDRATGDYMGMLATVINGLALQDALEKSGCDTRLMSAIEMHQVAEPFIRRRATRHLEKDRVVIFVAGTMPIPKKCPAQKCFSASPIWTCCKKACW